jgi:hypothetical protein
MIETAMYIGIGLLAGCLIAVSIAPLVHERAVRLTTRRLLATLPMSVTEIEAHQDLLRADFAMATRRSEIAFDRLRSKSAGQLVELSKKTDVINRLRLERDGLKGEVNELRAQTATLKRQVAAPQRPARPNIRVNLLRRWTPYRISIERTG